MRRVRTACISLPLSLLSRPVSVSLIPSSSLSLTCPPPPSLSQRQLPSNLGGNTLRLSTSDALLLANAPPIRLRTPQYRAPARRGRNPITGDVPKTAPVLQAALSSQTLTLHDGRPFIFPARGTIAALGGSIASLTSDATLNGSPGSKAKSEKLR